MSKSKSRITRPSHPVPATKEEANLLLIEIADRQNALAEIDKALAAAITTANTNAANEAKPLKEQLKARCDALQAFCGAHRDALTGGGKTKTVNFAAGTCSWRLSAGKVSIKGVADVLARLKTLGRAYAKFIRVTESIDKESMLKDADRANLVEGVTITKGEIFAIKPTASNIEELV